METKMFSDFLILKFEIITTHDRTSMGTLKKKIAKSYSIKDNSFVLSHFIFKKYFIVCDFSLSQFILLASYYFMSASLEIPMLSLTLQCNVCKN